MMGLRYHSRYIQLTHIILPSHMNIIFLSFGFLLPLGLFGVVAIGAERFRNFYTRLVFLCVSWVLWMISGNALSHYPVEQAARPFHEIIPGVSNGLALSSQLFMLLLLVSLWRVFPGRPNH